MDFAFTDEEEAFREELRTFIEAELPEWWTGMFSHDDRVMPITRQFCQKLAARGWLTMAWPEEYGGRAAGHWAQTVLREEMWAHDEPRGPQYMNLNYIGPLLMRFGTAEQQARFLPPMAAGQVLWCQGFSEPDSGSDLASLRTRAVVDGDEFVVNGQKIWTSYADAPAEWCIVLVRTDPDAPKHKGISVLLVDMTAPGVTVRPIEAMSGPHDINEVFFDDVRVPRDCLLGGLNEGWGVIVTGLTFERTGIARYARVANVIDRLVEEMNAAGRGDDPTVRQKLAELRIRCEAARLLSYRVVSLQARGEVPATEASVARVHGTLLEQEAGHVALDLLGPESQLLDTEHAPLGGHAYRQWVRNVPTTVASGTLEVQKNIIAERGLGLPRWT